MIKEKTKKISEKINYIVSSFIGANNFNDSIDEKLIRSILENKDINEKGIEYLIVNKEGHLVEEKIDYIDFLILEANELNKFVSNILANYATYIDYDLLSTLIECDELLSNKFFEAKIKNLKSDYNKRAINAVVRLNEINKNIN